MLHLRFYLSGSFWCGVWALLQAFSDGTNYMVMAQETLPSCDETSVKSQYISI